ncbi:MAG TPA: hypothetical protein VNO14_12705 [Blastocatellia bacterium]|nr:hypothetical protein [Blastocatellia bacterium]
MTRKKRTEITIETDEILEIRSSARAVFAWCAGCQAEVRIVTVDQAALLAGVSARSIYRRIESGQVHFAETPQGLLLVCLPSLMG